MSCSSARHRARRPGKAPRRHGKPRADRSEGSDSALLLRYRSKIMLTRVVCAADAIIRVTHETQVKPINEAFECVVAQTRRFLALCIGSDFPLIDMRLCTANRRIQIGYLHFTK